MGVKPAPEEHVHRQQDEHEHHHKELFIIRQGGAVEEVDLHEGADD